MSPRPIPASDLDDDAVYEVFVEALAQSGIEPPVPEWRFAPPRRWRLDFAWPDEKVALEVEGGIWTRGRHTRGAGFLKDMEKYNAAVMGGWRVVRCTPDTLCSVETLEMLKTLLLGNHLVSWNS